MKKSFEDAKLMEKFEYNGKIYIKFKEQTEFLTWRNCSALVLDNNGDPELPEIENVN